MRIFSIFTRFIGALMLVSILFSVTSCIAPVCYHDWVEATCDSPKYCTICNITDGKHLVHSGGVATCTALATCKYCNKQYGEYKSHSYNKNNLSADTDEYKHYFLCTICSAVNEGEEHTWNVESATYADDKSCTVCGYILEQKIPHEHTGGEADCESGAVCDLCNKAYTDPLPHTFVYDDENPNWTSADADKHYHKCTECGAHDEGEEHNWTSDGENEICDICHATRPIDSDTDTAE